MLFQANSRLGKCLRLYTNKSEWASTCFIYWILLIFPSYTDGLEAGSLAINVEADPLYY